MKIGPYSRSDQTKPSGILQKLHHHVRAYKKTSSIAPSGAEKIDPEVSKFKKQSFKGFLKKVFLFVLLILNPKKLPKKWVIFGTGCRKVSTRSVNGATFILVIYQYLILKV